MSVTYRYKCSSENALVWETRTNGPPSVCCNEGSAIVENTLTIVHSPLDAADLIVSSSANFDGAAINNLSHTSLQHIGTNTHAQIDTHIADAVHHRAINDAGTGATDLWSAAHLVTEFETKSALVHTHVAADVTDFDAEVDGRADARITAVRGVANGIAGLDSNGKVPVSQLNFAGVHFVGTWNANTNTPTIVSGVGTSGAYYVVSTAGTTTIDGISDWVASDWIVFNGTIWQKSDHTDAVSSVAGKQGAVTLVASDITNFAAAVSANTDVSASTTHLANVSNPHAVTIDQVTSASARGDLIAHNGTVHVIRSVGSNGTVLQADSAQSSGLKWVSNKKFIVSSKNTRSLDNTWTRVDHFIYPGASILPANVFRVLVNTQAESGVTYDVRLYDVTNGTEVAKVTGKNNTIPAISNMGTLSNIPAGDAQFEVHVIRTAGSDPNGVMYFSTTLEYQ